MPLWESIRPVLILDHVTKPEYAKRHEKDNHFLNAVFLPGSLSCPSGRGRIAPERQTLGRDLPAPARPDARLHARPAVETEAHSRRLGRPLSALAGAGAEAVAFRVRRRIAKDARAAHARAAPQGRRGKPFPRREGPARTAT